VCFLEVAWNRNAPGVVGIPERSQTKGRLASVDPGNAHICLALKDLDQLYHRLKSAGVDFVSAPFVSTGGHYTGSKTVYLHDPDGISLQLMEIHTEQGKR
jgi:extradiol dioxygenase family protein